MNRRTLLRGAALGVPAAALAAGGGIALAGGQAAPAASFKVMVTEQVANRVMVFRDTSSFGNGNIYKTFTPGGGAWANLSDARLRKTKSHGAVGLVAASGGNVGIWNITGKKHHEGGDILWSAAAGGNPHALERIPDLGAYVAACSDGYLVVYGPSNPNKPGSLAKVQTVELAGAHGVLWDPDSSLLWAIGDKVLRAYRVAGSKRDVRLKKTDKAVKLAGLGHDLQPDYSNAKQLLITDSYGVYEVNKSSGKKQELSGTTKVKAFVRHSSGTSFWVRADGKGEREWGSPTVHFSGSQKTSRKGAEFYKTRAYTVDYR